MCPGGDISALNEVLPLLQKVAAKDKNGQPCVGVIGKGGAGHYVKMMHNGIEHGMMSAISEAWGIMGKMGMGDEEIGDVLAQWNSEGELVGFSFTTSSRRTLTTHIERYLPRFHWRRLIAQTRCRASRHLSSP